jgi:glycerol-3-phosphate dehydrogenase (NAD(P)+)
MGETVKISILGCGNWGSVFGIIQHHNGHQVRLWEYDRERCERVQSTRDNTPFLRGHTIPPDIKVDWDLARIVEDTEMVVFAVPSQTLSSVVKALADIQTGQLPFLNLVKGIDIESLQRPSEIIREHLGEECRVFTLSGPCIANEIIRGAPAAAVVVGSPEPDVTTLQQTLTTEVFRLYHGNDMIGVELAAATKNVIALGCGISDGLGYGTNAKGALITRGIVEIQRLGVHMGAHHETFWGLSGLGDLVTTSFSEDSRNHRFGVAVGQGKTMEAIAREMVMVAEGVPTARAIKKLCERYGIEMPICDSVYEIVYNGKPPAQAIRELMTRPLTHE